MVLAHQVRTSLAIAAAGATVLGALFLTPSARTSATTAAAGDDGITLQARFATARMLPGAHDEDLAITITAPANATRARPPLSVAVVIDRSGSMDGAPLANAKAAAARLVDSLSPDDAFTIVTFSSGDDTVVAMGRATNAHKAEARAAIATIEDDGGTCASCGLVRGARELAASPIRGGVRRLVLMSDGQANEGIYDRAQLAQLVGGIARDGVSVSTVGVGLDFDEVTMTQLAEVGRGNYYFVEDTANLDAMFARELGGLAETVASDVRLTLTSSVAGVAFGEVYGYPALRTNHEADPVVVPIADLRAGETRKVVVHVRFAATGHGDLEIAHAALQWTRVGDGAARAASARAAIELVDDGVAVEASVIPDAARAIDEARSAATLEHATAEYQRGGVEAARKVLDDELPAIRARAAAIGDHAWAEQLDATSASTIGSFEAAPAASPAAAQATKAVRAQAYELAR